MPRKDCNVEETWDADYWSGAEGATEHRIYGGTSS